MPQGQKGLVSVARGLCKGPTPSHDRDGVTGAGHATQQTGARASTELRGSSPSGFRRERHSDSTTLSVVRVLQLTYP